MNVNVIHFKDMIDIHTHGMKNMLIRNLIKRQVFEQIWRKHGASFILEVFEFFWIFSSKNENFALEITNFL